MILNNNTASENDLIIKLVVLGDSAVGKTSLINQYINKSFEENYLPTLGLNITIIDMNLDDIEGNIRLILSDIAAQEKYECFTEAFFRGCSGAILVYDITRKETYTNIKKKWFRDFLKYGNEDGYILLIGNKSDLLDLRDVDEGEAKKLASEIKAFDFIETSAKSGENVEKAFEKIVNSLIKS